MEFKLWNYLIENYLANDKSRTQEYYAKPVPRELANVPPNSCKAESQRFQLLNETCWSNESKAFSKNKSHRNSLSTEENHVISNQTDQRYFDKLTFKQKIAVPTARHSELITDKHLNPHIIYSENDCNEVFVNNEDNLCDIKKCPNRQCSLESPITDSRRSRNRNQPFTEIPKVNYAGEGVKTNSNLLSVYCSAYENIKKTLNTDLEKVQGFHKEAYNISQHPYVPTTNNDKTSYLISTSEKLLKDMQGNLSSQWNSCDLTKNSRESKWKTEEDKSRKQCLQYRLEPIPYPISITRKKEQEAMTLSPKKITLRKFSGEESSQHTTNVFLNPIYTDTDTDSLYNISRDSRRNLNVNISYEQSIIPSFLPYSGNRCQSRKVLRRFI